MAFLSRLRSRARDDERKRPESAADAVRHLGAEDQDRLAELARGATSAAVRRAATRKLNRSPILGELAGDPDEGVRDEAVRALVALASSGGEGAEGALVELKDTRHLVVLARTATLPLVRRAALDRLSSPHALATVAKMASDPVIRLGALDRIEDPELLLAIALKSEHKDTAVGAMERLDLEKARTIAHSATSKAARRARTRLEPVPVPESTSSEVVEPSGAPSGGEDPESEPPLTEPLASPSPSSEEPFVAEATELEARGPEPQAEPPELTPREEPTRPHPARDEHEQRQDRSARVDLLCARLEREARAKGLLLRQAEKSLREAKAELLPDLAPRLERRLKAARAALFARAQ
jgi:hypothetical protein